MAEMVVARLVLGIVFLLSGASKFNSRIAMIDEVMQYELLSQRQARFVAALLPYAELCLGVLFVSGFLLPVASVASILLLGSFTIGVAVNLHRGRKFNCHCFGQTSGPIGWATILRNILLLTCGVFLAFKSWGATARSTSWMSGATDLRVFSHVQLLIPTAGSVLLALIMLFLLNEVQVERLMVRGSR